MTYDEQVEYLLDTHPAQLTATERELLRPTMQQVALFLNELNISTEEYTSRFATPQAPQMRYNINLH
jgi:hypothetical protein